MAASQNKEKLDDLFLAFEEICQISAWYWGVKAGSQYGYFNNASTTTTTVVDGDTIRDQHMRWARTMINKLRGWEVKPIGSLHMALVKHPLLIEESGSSAWRPMTDPPPKDRPILIWHDDAGDPYEVDGDLTSYGYWRDIYKADIERGAYVAHWVEEDPDDGPGWWFLDDDGNEIPLVPVMWKPIDMPKYNPYDRVKQVTQEFRDDRKDDEDVVPMKIRIIDASAPIEKQQEPWEAFLDKDEEKNDCPF